MHLPFEFTTKPLSLFVLGVVRSFLLHVVSITLSHAQLCILVTVTGNVITLPPGLNLESILLIGYTGL